MSRLAACFERLKQERKTALVAYVVAGDHNLDLCVPLMHDLVAHGVDVIELGYPFTDPAAEGPVIQAAHERALASGTKLSVVMDLVREFRNSNKETPVVLMGYLNPVERMGYKTFVKSAVSSGADGVLVVDWPMEAARKQADLFADAGLDMVLLATPTTSKKRMAAICTSASGYLYYVTLKGITGADSMDMKAVCAELAELRSRTKLPVCAGFGVKTAAQAKTLAEHAEGVVVGSALVDALANANSGKNIKGGKQTSLNKELSATIGTVLTPMRRALDTVYVGK